MISRCFYNEKTHINIVDCEREKKQADNSNLLFYSIQISQLIYHTDEEEEKKYINQEND